MKKYLAAPLCALAFSNSIAQGVQFETGNWKSVLAKAKKEHKLIYMDVYTTWCGPCKILATQVFPQKAAGDKYNKLFVNYRVDAEKGEGIELAKKYEVNGYPTNLFIDPDNGAVVYRTSGTSGEVAPFVAEADKAIREQHDPMTWDKYTNQFKAGKRDKAFLRAYLEKANVLNKENDAILDAYVAVLSKSPVIDSEVFFVADRITTSDNNAVAYLSAHRDILDARPSDFKVSFDERLSRWNYGTFEKAVAGKRPELLDQISATTAKYGGSKDETKDYWYRTQYYTRIGDEAGALRAGSMEAEFLLGKMDDYFNAEDLKESEKTKLMIRQQLIMMKVPADRLDEKVQENLERNPSMKHPVSVQTANTLNSIAWNIYERHAADKALVEKGLRWSKRSLELAAGTEEWHTLADTYAHLQYAAGQKDEAIKLETQVVEKARELKANDLAAFEEALQHMKSGTL